MKTIVSYAAILGFAVVAWTFVMGVTGWFRHPVLLRLFFLVIPLQIALLVGMLSRTAAQGRGYGGQVFAGTLASALAAVLIVGGSLLFTTVAFPHYLEELRAVHVGMMRDQGLGESEIAAALAHQARHQTPLGNALAGGIGTVVTGLVTSLVAGAFIRAQR